MKKTIAGLATVAALSSGVGANAQQSPTSQTGLDTNARAMGLVTPQTPNLSVLHAQFGEVDIRGVSSQSGNGLSVTGATGSEKFALGAQVTLTQHAKEALATLGIAIGDNTVISFGGSMREEAANQSLGANYPGNATLRENGGFIKIDYNPHGGVKKFSLAYVQNNAQETLLNSTNSTITSSSTADLGTYTATTTNTYNKRTDEIFSGGMEQNLLVASKVNFGTNGEVTFTLGNSQKTILNTRTNNVVGGIRGDYFGGNWKGYASIDQIGKDTLRTAIGYERQFSDGVAGVLELQNTNTPNMPNNTSVFGGIKWTFGGKSSRYSRDDSVNPLSALRIAQENVRNAQLAPSPISSLGKVYTTETVTQTGSNTIDTAKTPDPVTISDISIDADGNVTISTTSPSVSASSGSTAVLKNQAVSTLPAGYTLECSINSGTAFTCTDGKISASKFDLTKPNTLSVVVVNSTVAGQVKRSTAVTKTINFTQDSPTQTTENTVVVTDTTATIPLSLADTDGIKDYTCQVYAGSTALGSAVTPTGTRCTVSGLSASTSYTMVEKAIVAQKKPNGTIEYVAVEKRTPFTTEAPTNQPGTITPPTLSSRTSSTLTLTVGTTTGMTNVRVVLYSDSALTQKVGESPTGSFIELSASTPYYALTLADDLNENTGATETKQSEKIQVTTDKKPNTAPDAKEDTSSTAFETAVEKDVIANDTDADGNPLTIIGTPTASNGTVTVGADKKTLRFTPAIGFSGVATVNYTITDGNGGTDSAIWTITVAAKPNTAPVANPDSASVNAGQSVSIAVLTNDTDTDGDPLTIGIYTQPASGGTVSKSGNNLVFTSDGTVGTFTFTCYPYDGKTNSLTPATVTVVVNALAPTLSFTSPTVSGTVGGASTQTPTSNSDGAITYISSNPTVASVDANGTVTYLSAGSATITANQVANGKYAAASASYAVNVSEVYNTPSVSVTPTTYTGFTDSGNISLPQLNILFGNNIASWKVITSAAISNSFGGLTLQSGTGTPPTTLNTVNIANQFVEGQGFIATISLQITDTKGNIQTILLESINAS